MKPIARWFCLIIALCVGSFVGWHFGIGIWAAYSYYQFTLSLGQGIIMVGIFVLLQEVERQWYDE